MSMRITAVPAMAFVFSLLFSAAAFAGLFGPSTYEECILENMKGINNEIAAYSVRGACEKKFPNVAEKESVRNINPPNSYRVDASTGARYEALVNNLVILKNYPNGIQIMNKNSFAIKGIYVGEVAKEAKNCPSNEKDFKAIHWCKGFVGSNQSGRVTCNENIGTFCISGFVTEFLTDPDKFMKENGLR